MIQRVRNDTVKRHLDSFDTLCTSRVYMWQTSVTNVKVLTNMSSFKYSDLVSVFDSINPLYATFLMNIFLNNWDFSILNISRRRESIVTGIFAYDCFTINSVYITLETEHESNWTIASRFRQWLTDRHTWSHEVKRLWQDLKSLDAACVLIIIIRCSSSPKMCHYFKPTFLITSDCLIKP